MMISIGEFIRFFRVRHKMTQQELADLLGMTPKGLRNIGKGQSVPRAATLSLFEDYFKVKISRFYPSNVDMLTLETYRLMMEMLDMAHADIAKAHELAIKLERLDRFKNNTCLMNILYVKAKHAGEALGEWQQAQALIFEALGYVNYVAYDHKLQIDSFLPCPMEYAVLHFLGTALFKQNDPASIQVFESIVASMETILSDKTLSQILTNLEEINELYGIYQPNLAKAYYYFGRYEEALLVIKKSLVLNAKSVNLVEKYRLQFMILCAMDKEDLALKLLPDLFAFSRRLNGNRHLRTLVGELKENYPHLSKKIGALYKMYSALGELYM